MLPYYDVVLSHARQDSDVYSSLDVNTRKFFCREGLLNSIRPLILSNEYQSLYDVGDAIRGEITTNYVANKHGDYATYGKAHEHFARLMDDLIAIWPQDTTPAAITYTTKKERYTNEWTWEINFSCSLIDMPALLYFTIPVFRMAVAEVRPDDEYNIYNKPNITPNVIDALMSEGLSRYDAHMIYAALNSDGYSWSGYTSLAQQTMYVWNNLRNAPMTDELFRAVFMASGFVNGSNRISKIPDTHGYRPGCDCFYCSMLRPYADIVRDASHDLLH